MTALEVGTHNFKDVIENHSIVIFDFWASWCGPCRSFAPVFEAAAKQHPDVVFAKINTEEHQELAAALNIQAIPTLMAFKEQVAVFAQPGALPAPVLDELVTKLKELDMAPIKAEIAADPAR